MLLPGDEKQAKQYQQAYQRMLRMHRRYPQLAELEQRIGELFTNISISNATDKSFIKGLRDAQDKYQEFLKSNNIPFNYNKPQFDCLNCRDSGWIEEKDVEASEIYGYEMKRMVKCNCLRNAEHQFRLNRLFKISQLPQAMLRQTFKRFRLDVYSDIALHNGFTHRKIMTHNKDIAQEFVTKVAKANGKGVNATIRGLYFQGKPGVGKTFLCSAIANDLLRLGVPVLYLPFVDFLYQLRDTFGDRNSKMEEFIAAAREVDVLILDDLGSENITDFSQEVLFTLLNYRLMNNVKPVVISSNYSIEELHEMYHPRIASRISKQAHILPCVGDDLREKLR